MKTHRAHGFTLLELVAVILIISVGALTLGKLMSNAGGSLTRNEILQQATQYAQECTEKILADARNVTFLTTLGYSNVSNSSCNSLPAPQTTGGISFTRTVSVTPNATSACPTGSSVLCENVLVTVTASSTPSMSSSITLMITN